MIPDHVGAEPALNQQERHKDVSRYGKVARMTDGHAGFFIQEQDHGRKDRLGIGR